MEDSAARIELDLSTASLEALELFMDETDDEGLFVEILVSNRARADALKLLAAHPRTPDEVRAEASSVLNLPVLSSTAVAEIKRKDVEKRKAQPEAERSQRLSQRVQKLGVSEKIKIAMRGNGEVRSALLKDSNKLVVMSVLSNPRITDPEIEAVARSRSIMEDAIREIARNKEWMKSYKIQFAIVTNPKTPAGLALRYMSSLKKQDLKILEKNKNVSEAVRTMARKLVKGQAE